MVSTSTADAVARESAWLNTFGDGLPALPAAAGGPWNVVQGYWPGLRLATQQTGIYVLRRHLADDRVANLRIRDSYEFNLKLVWPVKASTAPLAETEQQNFDNAIDLLIQRIRGPVGDKTHGGAFLSVGEVPREQPVSVGFSDPEQTIPAEKALRALVTYYADDIEING
jgi:hypothetical protein